jgi:hypothetical protein
VPARRYAKEGRTKKKKKQKPMFCRPVGRLFHVEQIELRSMTSSNSVKHLQYSFFPMEKQAAPSGYQSFVSSDSDSATSTSEIHEPPKNVTLAGYSRYDEQKLFAEICSRYDQLKLVDSYGSFGSESPVSAYTDANLTGASQALSGLRMYEVPRLFPS